MARIERHDTISPAMLCKTQDMVVVGIRRSWLSIRSELDLRCNLKDGRENIIHLCHRETRLSHMLPAKEHRLVLEE